MVGKDIPSIADAGEAAIQATAAKVGADILAQYRQLALALRQRGWDEIAAMGGSIDSGERACRQCAFQLYGTAASELDDIIADLLDSLDHPYVETGRIQALHILDGGRAD
ncbi:hypothetical protein [Methylobacterium sp. P5_C11]